MMIVFVFCLHLDLEKYTPFKNTYFFMVFKKEGL